MDVDAVLGAAGYLHPVAEIKLARMAAEHPYEFRNMIRDITRPQDIDLEPAVSADKAGNAGPSPAQRHQLPVLRRVHDAGDGR